MTDYYSRSGFPRGWFVVSFSEELAPGEVKPLRYFAQDLVLFRTESGEPKVLDAWCPHMGMHLAHGGVVEGETIECPFHLWRFDGDGKCVDIPYSKRIPSKGHTECWPVRERNGMILVWHDRDKNPPQWEVPALSEWGDQAWTSWNHDVVEIKTHPHAIVENVADTGHFIPVHQTHVDSFEAIFEDHTATQINSGTAFPVGGGKDKYSIRATYYGPAVQYSRMDGFLSSRLVNAHTPIEENLLHLRFGVMLELGDDPRQTEEFSKQYVANLRDGFFQDIRIWEHKRFLERPALCDGDGPVARLRSWYDQFFQAQESAGSAS